MPRRLKTPSPASLLARAELGVRAILEQGSGTRIIAAVSGGVDSVTLLDILLALRRRLGLTIAVAHVNHKLRAEADSDERFVRRLAEERSLDFHAKVIHVSAIAATDRVSTEMAGRTARYAFFRRLLETTDYDAVATAHTRTDNAETVILNLARGAGVKSLAGIPAMRPMGAKSIVRPLLTFDKSELLAYAKSRRLRWREDKTNREISIPRNFIRLAILPEFQKLNPRFTEAIARTSGIVGDLLVHLRPQIDKAKRDLLVSRIPSRSLSIALQPLKGYFGFLRSFALHELLRETFPDVLFSAADVNVVIGLANRQTGARGQLDGGVVALRDRARINLNRGKSAVVSSVSLVADSSANLGDWAVSIRELPRKRVVFGTPTREYIDASAAGTRFTLRAWRAGDRMIPFGMTTTKKVSDLLTNSKIPSGERKNALVLESDQHIVWLCGLRIDNRVRVTNSTTRVLELKIAPNEHLS